MDKVVLQVRVTPQDEGYQAMIDALVLEARGGTIDEAQDNLIKSFRIWLEGCEEQENLEQAMAEAGLPGVHEDTELELHFVTSEEAVST